MFKDYKAIIEELSLNHNIKTSKVIGNEMDFYYCPSCIEHQIDINIEKGVFKCHRCSRTGNIKDLYDSLEGEGEYYRKYIKDSFNLKLDLEKITYQLQTNLRKSRNKVPLQYLYNYRLYTDETIEFFKIGYAGEDFKITELSEKHYHLKNCITFPIFNKSGEIINIKFKQVQKITPDKYFKNKIFNLSGYGSSTTNYIHYTANADKLWIFEGEPDAILANQVLINNNLDFYKSTNIISPTAGANSIPREWDQDYFNIPTTIFYDNDFTGQRGMSKINHISANIRQANLENVLVNKEKDFTDLVRKVGEERSFKLLLLLETLAINENKGVDMLKELNAFKESLNRTLFKDFNMTLI